MRKQVRVRSNLFVFRMFLTAANHSKQNTMRVWSRTVFFRLLFFDLTVTVIVIYI